MKSINQNLSFKIINLLKKVNLKKNNFSDSNINFHFTFPTIISYLKKLNEKGSRKKRRGLIKRRYFLKKLLSTPSAKALLENKRNKYYHFKKRKKRREGALFDSTNLLNILKVKSRFEDFQNKTIKYCKLYFKYTGSNFFVTLTNIKGDVFFSYSAGVFQNLRTRKEKTTIFVAKELGELLGLRLLKLLTRETVFIPFLNHRKIKTLLRFFFSGVVSLGPTGITKIMPKRKVARNGVRLKKAVRK